MRGELLEKPDLTTRCCERILEDIPGGCVLEKSELVNTGFMNEGILISLDDNKVGHLVKTCKLWTGVSTSATNVAVYKNHEFKVGDIVTNTALTTISRNITAIDTSYSSYDVFSFASGLGVEILTGEILIEAQASGCSGVDASYKYIPDAVGIAKEPINLAFQNTGFGLLVRGTVKESLMPYPVDSTIKALFPLIRFT